MTPAAGAWPAGAPSSDSSTGQWRGLLHVVVVAEGGRQREPRAEVACGGVVEQSTREPGVAERDPNRRLCDAPASGSREVGLDDGAEVLIFDSMQSPSTVVRRLPVMAQRAV